MAELLALTKETFSIIASPLLVLIVWRVNSLEKKTHEIARDLETKTASLARMLAETTTEQMRILLEHVDKKNDCQPNNRNS